MRTFDKSKRISLGDKEDSCLFSPELEYYRNHNLYPVVLFGKNITNIYKNINVQLVISRFCNFKCGFCIENDGAPNIENSKQETDPVPMFKSVLEQYISQGVIPNVSITGGEPTLFPKRLIPALQIALGLGITRLTVNTNGANLEPIAGIKGYRINLSRHHWIPEKIKSVFQRDFKKTMLPEKTVMQCVMMKDYVETINDIKSYMEHFKSQGAIGFSFRGLTKLDAEKNYHEEINFSGKHAIDFPVIADEIANDPDFEFLQQKIGDHYWYEMYKYKGLPVRLTYSNFAWLRKTEAEERKNHQWFSRATIVLPDGNVYAGWTYDINKIT